jgi:hypothetical protein
MSTRSVVCRDALLFAVGRRLSVGDVYRNGYVERRWWYLVHNHTNLDVPWAYLLQTCSTAWLINSFK